jgi:hypothetical protein
MQHHSRFISYKLLSALPVMLLCLLSSLPTLAGSLDDYYLAQYAEKNTAAEAVKSTALAADVDISAQCGTPLKHGLKRDWKLLETGTQKILAKQLASPVLTGEATYTSSAGHFKVHYATSGTDAPPPADANSNGVPDWVETVAVTFENVYTSMGTMGYRPAPTETGMAYDIYLLDLATQGFYGVTTSDISIPSASYPYAYSSWIELDNNFTDSIYKPLTYTALQSLQMTAAHEYHHAVQYGYNLYFDIWYAEATSTWLEDELYDGINQLYSYIPGWLKNSTKSLDIAVGSDATKVGAGYGRWLFNRYLAEKHGATMIRGVWDAVAATTPTGYADDIPMTPLIENALTTSYSTNLGSDFLGFAKRIYTRDWATHTTEISQIHTFMPVSTYSNYPITTSSYPTPSVTLPHYSFAYYKFTPSATASSALTVSINKTSGIAAAVFKKVGGIVSEISSDTTGTIFTVTGLGNLDPMSDEVVLLLVNTTGVDGKTATFSTTSGSSSSNNSKPLLTVSAPSQDVTITQSALTVSGTVSNIITTTKISITVDGQTYTPTVATDGSFSQLINLTTDKTYSIVVTATDQAGNSTTVQRNIIKTTAVSYPSGDITGDGKVDIADALKALRIAVGLETATAAQLAIADVAPLSGGKPASDGKIDIADALVILEKSVGLVGW